nr:reverse transcriptase domain-containing protein [Tanacetum cinerariifolium]
ALVFELVVAPVCAPMPNLKPSIPYPSMHNNERRRDQANEQIEKFYKIFKDMSFEISFTDALILMHKIASTLKALIGNKEKLSEMARTPMNKHYSTVILNKLPRKLGDPDKFLIPCEFPGMDECLALADLGASINLMPLSVWEGLSLSKHTLTCVTLELADRSVSKPIGIAKDVSVKVGVFHFPADFVVVDFEPDHRVPLILGEVFLKDRYSANYNQMTANKIDVIDMACEEYSQEVLGFSDVTEVDAFLDLEDDPNSPKFNPFYYNPERDILLLEAILNSEPLPLLPNHEQYMPSFKKELKSHFMVKEGIVLDHKISKNGIEVDKPKVDVISKLPHPTTVKGVWSFLGHASFYRRFIQDFSKISRPMTHLLEKNTSFICSEDCIKAFQMLKKLTEAPILIAPNWDLPFELMCDVSDFAICVVLEQHHEKHFRPIHYASKPMTDAESNYTTTEKEMFAVVYAFEKFRSYLIMNKSIVHTDHSTLKYLFAKKDAKARLLRWVLLLQEVDFKVLDTKGAENLATDHLS